jgi:adapter protein MecA 1/2
MKIEKLTENKIRIIVNSYDLENKNLDFKALLSRTLDSQGFFLDMLEKAKTEVGFNTDGCKILVEAFSTTDEYLIFTITKYVDKSNTQTGKRPKVKMKNLNISATKAIYKLDNFDVFCDLCTYLNNNFSNITKISKCSSLYLYNNNYYLLIRNNNISKDIMQNFYISISEFLSMANLSSNFENKLFEHGKAIIKNNAILTGIKYFVH